MNRKFNWLTIGAAFFFLLVCGLIERALQCTDALATLQLPSAKLSSLVELPRPNSGTFSFREAELRKREIFDATPTGRIGDWTAPALGGGCCIHLDSHDQLRIYNYSGHPPFHGSLKTLEDLGLEDLAEVVDCISIYNEPARVILTTEISLKSSRSFPKVLELLYRPSIQILYVGVAAPKAAQSAVGNTPLSRQLLLMTFHDTFFSPSVSFTTALGRA